MEACPYQLPANVLRALYAKQQANRNAGGGISARRKTACNFFSTIRNRWLIIATTYSRLVTSHVFLRFRFAERRAASPLGKILRLA
jgi:hypothetical protein